MQVPSGCWEWQAARTASGYGAMRAGGFVWLAHRLSVLFATNSPLPPDRQVDHLCMNVRCVNPNHLELVTGVENVRRSYATNVSASRQRAKTHCPQGHPYDEVNTYLKPNGGGRDCRACRRDALIRSRRRRTT